MRTLRVGSRASPLSLAQTEEILDRLRPAHPGRRFLVVPVTTGGDRRKDAPLLSLGRGAFAKEIETALIDGEIDFAVHSAKDVPIPAPRRTHTGNLCGEAGRQGCHRLSVW